MVRYANLTLRSDASITNIGDWVQIIAIDNIYKTMGVMESEIVRLPIDELSTYRGDKLILPVNFPMFGIYELSPDIIPVYLGISIIHHSVADGLKLRQYEPIGCRDDHSYKVLSSIGINCYHGGCLSITYPKRSISPQKEKIFLVGLSDRLYNALPSRIRESGIRMDHVSIRRDDKPDYQAAYSLLEEYSGFATLVVTSKIHCAQPCLAMGIPTVFICEEKSFRFEVISRYIPIYSFEDLCSGRINWNPLPIDLEKNKFKMIQNAVIRIKTAYDNTVNSSSIHAGDRLVAEINKMNSVSDLYGKTGVEEYTVDMLSGFIKYLKNKYEHRDSFKYAIWGISQFAYATVDYIRQEYPNARLDLVIDQAKRFPFYGIMPASPESLRNYPHTLFFTAPSAVGIAKEALADLGVSNYVVSYGGINIENGKDMLLPYCNR